MKTKNAGIALWMYLILSCISGCAPLLSATYQHLVLLLLLILTGYFIWQTLSTPAPMQSVAKFRSGIYICALLMVISALLHLLFSFRGYGWANGITDIVAMAVYLYATTLVGSDFDQKFSKHLLAITVCAGLVGLYAVVTSNLYAVHSLSDRSKVVHILQYYLWYILEFWPLPLCYIITNWEEAPHRKLFLCASVVCAFEYIMLSLLFLKRLIFIQILILAFIILLALWRQIAKVMKTVLVAVILVIAAMYFLRYIGFDVHTLTDLIFRRYASDSLESFDRWVEFTNLFKDVGSQFMIIGMGFGSSQRGPGNVNLHLGILNFLFKGGFFFLLFMLENFRKCFAVLLSNIPLQKKWFSMFAAYTFFYSCLAAIWTPNPARILFAFCMVKSLCVYEETHETAK